MRGKSLNITSKALLVAVPLKSGNRWFMTNTFVFDGVDVNSFLFAAVYNIMMSGSLVV